MWVPATSLGCTQAPAPALPALHTHAWESREEEGCPEAGNGNKTPVGEVAHLQSEVGQQAGGSHRWRGSSGGCPPAPKLRSRCGKSPGVESQRSQGLSEPQFSGGRGEEKGEEEEERKEGGGGGGGGRNWETEV